MDGIDFSNIPLQPPPEGVRSNFENPDSLAILPKVFIYVTLGPMVLFLILRFYTRAVITRNVGIDDWLSAAGGVLMIVYCSLMLTILDKPSGRHSWDIRLSEVTPLFVALSTLPNGVYFIAAMFIKSSILLLYRRLFHVSTIINIMIWIGLSINVLYYTIIFAVFTAYCVPHSKDWPVGGWMSVSYNQHCIKASGPTAASSGLVGTLIDIYILVLPLIPIARLRTSVKRKVGISGLFIAGSSACIFSIVGCVYRFKLQKNPGYDISYRGMPMYAMNIGEVNLGIISSSLPVIFILFKGFTSKPLTWINRLRYYRRTAREHARTGASDVEMLNYQKDDGDKLPAVPNGTLTGLKKWIRNKNSTTAVTETQATALTTANGVLTYVSADYAYHAHLKAGLSSGPGVSVQRELNSTVTVLKPEEQAPRAENITQNFWDETKPGRGRK